MPIITSCLPGPRPSQGPLTCPMQRDEAIAYLAGRVLLGLNDSMRHVHDNSSIQSIVPLLVGAFIRQFPKQKNWSVQFEDTQTPSRITKFQHQPPTNNEPLLRHGRQHKNISRQPNLCKFITLYSSRHPNVQTGDEGIVTTILEHLEYGTISTENDLQAKKKTGSIQKKETKNTPNAKKNVISDILTTPWKISGWNIIPWRFGSENVPFLLRVMAVCSSR